MSSDCYVVLGVSYSLEELIHKYLHLVKFVVGRMSSKLPVNVDTNDLINEGVIGLIDAIKKYDDSRNVKFETYAITRIYGTVVDSIRALDWAPRHVRTFAKQMEAAVGELITETGRVPSKLEVAQKLGMSTELFEKSALRVSGASVGSLEDPGVRGHKNGSPMFTVGDLVKFDGPDVSSDIEFDELSATLGRAIDRLNEQERKVVEMYYFESRNLKEIAAVLEVSETRVSQIHSRAVVTLRQRLKALREELGIRENDPNRRMKYLASARRAEEKKRELAERVTIRAEKRKAAAEIALS